MISLTAKPIDPQELFAAVSDFAAGAVVLFAGTAREFTGDRRTAWLEYESYRELAERKLAELEAEARRRWPLVGCAIAHRLGRVDLGEVSVVVAVSSAHRREAFDAGQWLIDTLKEVVPIWKREHWADGAAAWIHPDPEGESP
jgi:molybdopterin synthase catalytic subunit